LSATDIIVVLETPKFLTCTDDPKSPCRTDGYEAAGDEANKPKVMLSPTQATWVGVRTCAAAREPDSTAVNANSSATPARNP
jgi:hypothetical protein